MTKGKYIADLVSTDPIYDCVFAVKNHSFPESNGKKRAVLTLSDRTGDRPAVRWDVTEAEADLIKASRLIVICGEISPPASKYPNQITISKVRAHVEAPGDHVHFVVPPPDDQETTLRRFADLRDRIGNRHLVALLHRFFDREDYRADFQTAVAAGSHHHAFRGGLLRHTVEVAELCRKSCEVLPFLRHDLIVTAALLHDTGKVTEMDQGFRAGTFTANGALIGHIHGGAFEVMQYVRQDESFPAGLAEALVHLILSHHEQAEWGSPKTPALPEATVLAQCDQISAHATEFWDTIVQNRDSGQVSVKRGDRYICVADLGLDTLDLRGLDAPVSAEADGLSLASLPAITIDRTGLEGDLVRLPVRGLVAAGDGERSSEFPLDTGEELTVVLPSGGADYLVDVVGESMIEAGILPGDRAFVRHQETAASGDIVVAYVPSSGNVIKRFVTTPKGIFLKSENPDAGAYPPIPFTLETLIQGVVTRVERDLG